MTARSVSWTDPKALAALLARVPTARKATVTTAVRAMGSNAAPARFAPAPKAEVAAPPPRKVPTPIIHSADNPVDRLDQLIVWTMENFTCSGAFVADDNGLTLAANGISEALVSLVGPLFTALVRVRTIEGVDANAGALRLGAQMLSWVEVRTEHGGFCLGVLADEPLPRSYLDVLATSLQRTVEEL